MDWTHCSKSSSLASLKNKMSDEEYEYEYDEDASADAMDEGDHGKDSNNDDEEEEEFEYTDAEDDVDDVDVALENTYYNAKAMRETNLQDAVQALESVIVMENEALSSSSPSGPWSFKALKQLIKIFLRSNDVPKTIFHYRRLLECISNPKLTGVSPNAIEKSINGMMERVSSVVQSHSVQSLTLASLQEGKFELAKQVYDGTRNTFNPHTGSCPNERLWLKTNIKYGQLLYEMNDTVKLQLVIRDLVKASNIDVSTNEEHEKSITNTSSSSSASNTHLMEIYALQIQLYSRLKDNAKLRAVFFKAMRVQSGSIPHPRTIALIQEFGGKMYMARREFEAAGPTFFQAFKSYDEAGDHPARIRCLRYLVMASMLHASTINPFDSQEARPYRDDPDIVAMTKLVQAFHNNEIKTFERIFQRNEGKIMDDEFLREYIGDLLRTIRTQVLLKAIEPYEKIRLSAISKNFLNGIDVKDVESLLVDMILDGKLNGRIDQIEGILMKMNQSSEDSNVLKIRQYDAVDELTLALKRLTSCAASASHKS